MSKYDEMRHIAAQHNGYLRVRDVEHRGIDRSYVYRMLKDNPNEFDKAAKGIYVSTGTTIDWAYVLQLRNQKAILSDHSALWIHGLIPSVHPLNVYMTVPKFFNVRHLEARKDLHIHVTHCDDKYLEIGHIQKETPLGNMVNIYDMERCICDLIRKKDWKGFEIEDNVYITALRSYFSKANMGRDSKKLLEYADVFGIKKRAFEIMILLQDQ